MNSDTQEVLAATAKLVREVRQYAPGFGIGAIPSRTDQMAPLYAITRTHLREIRYEVATAMALPFRDGHIIGLAKGRKAADLVFSKGHELGHVVSGEVGSFLTSEDTMSFSERRADLFSLVDLATTPWMATVNRRRPFKTVVQSVKDSFRYLTYGWSAQRLHDRAQLRVQLFREYGI